MRSVLLTPKVARSIWADEDHNLLLYSCKGYLAIVFLSVLLKALHVPGLLILLSQCQEVLMGKNGSCPACQFRSWASRSWCKEEPCVAPSLGLSVRVTWGSRSKVLYLVHSLVTSLSGYTTCVLTNDWVDDSAQRGSLAQLLCQLRPHFDFLIESCRIGMTKPDPQIYKFVLETMKASPSEVCGHFFWVKENVLEIVHIRKREEGAGGGLLGPSGLMLGLAAGSHSPRPEFPWAWATLCGFYRSKQVLSNC